jgi:hypothetical protein
VTPEYVTIVKNPKDLGTILGDLGANKYQNAGDVWQDCCLVWKNCTLFHRKATDRQMRQLCKGCEENFVYEWKDRGLPMPKGVVVPKATVAPPDPLVLAGAALTATMKDASTANWFGTPVAAAALGLSDYFTIIKSPKDLGTIVSDLQRHKYPTVLDVWKDVCLVWSNCVMYNSRPENEDIRKICKRSEKLFLKEWHKRQLPTDTVASPAKNSKAKSVKGTCSVCCVCMCVCVYVCMCVCACVGACVNLFPWSTCFVTSSDSRPCR